MAAKKARSNRYSGLLSTRARGVSDQRPWRSLTALAVVIVALYATMFGVNATHPRLAIDLAGGTSAVFAAVLPHNRQRRSAGDMGQAVAIMQERVNGYGVSEATVNKEGSDTIDVEIPGQYSQATVDSIGATAHLYFRPVLEEPARRRHADHRHGERHLVARPTRHRVRHEQRQGERQHLRVGGFHRQREGHRAVRPVRDR